MQLHQPLLLLPVEEGPLLVEALAEHLDLCLEPLELADQLVVGRSAAMRNSSGW